METYVTDRILNQKEIIESLKICAGPGGSCGDCHYKPCDDSCRTCLMIDALALIKYLKAGEPNKAKPLMLKDLNSIYVEHRCGKFLVPLDHIDKQHLELTVGHNLSRLWLGYPTEEERDKREWEDIK